MYTELGKYLRHLRLDNYENMKEMATRLGVSSSFLSAVEVGKKTIPAKWFDLIVKTYNLNEEEQKAMKNAIDITNREVYIPLENLQGDREKVSLMFARSISDVDDKTLEKIKELLEKEKQD